MAQCWRLPCSLSGVWLWSINLSAPLAPHQLASPSEVEWARAWQFRFARDRHRYLCAHSAVRDLLARHIGCGINDLAFGCGEFGKPFLVSAPTLSFNLSHSNDHGLFAISQSGEIGVDIEVLHDLPDVLSLANVHFTQGERDELARVPADQRHRAFLTCWTRKEACLKALGVGLRLLPSSFEVGLFPGMCSVTLGQPSRRVHLESIEPADGIIGALAQQV